MLDGSGWWAMDNGAFTGFDAQAFQAKLDRYAGWPRCAFVACPDVVGDWATTRAQFTTWSPIIRDARLPVAVVLQDGVTVPQVPWVSIDAVFVGGTTDFKLGAVARECCAYARALGKWVHMGRVNSRRRFRYAAEIGCHSIDGTLFSAFPDESLRRVTRWMAHLTENPRLW